MAPWLKVDGDAYPAVVEGRIVWIVDGYTTSNSYPNSERVNLNHVTSDAQTSVGRHGGGPAAGRHQLHAQLGQGRGRRVRRHGQAVRLGRSRSGAEDLAEGVPGRRAGPRPTIPQDLLDHLRYPQDLFKVQRQILASYHITDPGTWYSQLQPVGGAERPGAGHGHPDQGVSRSTCR